MDVKKILVNPFDDDIVAEPWDIPKSVAGLNNDPLERLVSAFSNIPKGKVPTCKAQLVISPDRGYGKSHLLGRLFSELDNKATLIYLRPYEDPDKYWHSILLQTVQELERPDSINEETLGAPSQLAAFANGVISHLAAEYLSRGEAIGHEEVSKIVQLLKDKPLEVFRITHETECWSVWVQSLFDTNDEFHKLTSKLQNSVSKLLGREGAWLRVLFAYSFSQENSEEKQIALKWIRGEPLEESESDLLGVSAADNDGKGEMTCAEINELSYKRLSGLCRLAGFYRPFLFCFDQTEFFAGDKNLIRSFGNCIDKLFSEVPNQMSVVTANQNNWFTDLLPQIGLSQRDRFSSPVELQSVELTQAKEIIYNRLLGVGFDFKQLEEFYGDEWLQGLLKAGGVSVRAVLQGAAYRFRELQGKSTLPIKKDKVRIEELFKIQVNLVKTKTASQAYSQDALMWFTHKLMDGADGISASRIGNYKWFSVKWTFENKTTYFAFEGGDNSARWQAIAKESTAIGKMGSGSNQIIFRTPDLAKVPKASWKAIGPKIEEATKLGLKIHSLDSGSVCEIHAARDLYSDALQGNIDEKPVDILNWLKTYFQSKVKIYFENSPANAPKSQALELEKPTIKIALLSHEQKGEVLKFIEKKRWVAVDEVIKHFKLDVTEEALLKSLDGHPIKTFPGPKTIVIQWRKTISA